MQCSYVIAKIWMAFSASFSDYSFSDIHYFHLIFCSIYSIYLCFYYTYICTLYSSQMPIVMSQCKTLPISKHEILNIRYVIAYKLRTRAACWAPKKTFRSIIMAKWSGEERNGGRENERKIETLLVYDIVKYNNIHNGYQFMVST